MTTKTDATTVTTMTKDEAETVTAEIKAHGSALVSHRTKFESAITRARKGAAHVALGFESWTAYVADTFTMPELGKYDREYLTAFMVGEGMSSRAVARVLGVSQSTANRMVKALEDKGEIAADRSVEDLTGRKQTAKGAGRGVKAGTKGKGKGDKAPAKVDAAKVDKAPAKVDADKGETSTPTVPGDADTYNVVSVRTAKTDELRSLALMIVRELSGRWQDGDEAAEAAMTELADASMTLF